MYETSIQTRLVSATLAVALGAGLLSVAGSKLHETRITAGLISSAAAASERAVAKARVLREQAARNAAISGTPAAKTSM